MNVFPLAFSPLPQASGTIGGTYLAKRIVVDGTIMNLKIWDTAGQVATRVRACVSAQACVGERAAVCAFVLSPRHRGSRL